MEAISGILSTDQLVREALAKEHLIWFLRDGRERSTQRFRGRDAMAQPICKGPETIINLVHLRNIAIKSV